MYKSSEDLHLLTSIATPLSVYSTH